MSEIVDQIQSPWFGVNYDPSNTILAGEDPLVLLEKVKHRVVSMHASDRYLKDRDARGFEAGKRIRSATPAGSRIGVIGKGHERLRYRFSPSLNAVGFQARWISIEDGMDGMDDLRESVQFL